DLLQSYATDSDVLMKHLETCSLYSGKESISGHRYEGHSALADAVPVTGIVWAYRFRPNGVAEPISNDKIEAALAEPGTGWMWLHLALADTRCRAWIAQHAPISELAREVLGGPDRHMRLDIIGNESGAIALRVEAQVNHIMRPAIFAFMSPV